MFPRLILAFVLALLAFLPAAARTYDSQRAYTFLVRMKATVSGWVQVFGNVGYGFSPQLSSAVPLSSGSAFREYRLPLPVGRYVGFRLDPGIGGGRYEIADAAILDAAGGHLARIPLESLMPVNQLSTIGRNDGSLIVEAPPGSNDPQLMYTPPSPVELPPSTDNAPALVRRLLLWTSVAFVGLWLVELAFANAARALSRHLEGWARSASANAHVTIAISAFAATLLSCYPTLIFGRSLVSPNNGPVPMLYSRPPFVAYSDDRATEDIRTSDIGAMMWAFVPYAHVQRTAIAEGEVPLWNRYSSVGVPLWGQGQSFMLDPLHWIALLGSDPAPGLDLKFAAHRFVTAWGVGVAALVAIGATAPAAIAAAMSPFIGFYVFRFNHPAVFILAYAPWVLAGWFLLARAASRRECARAALLIAIASSLLLAASPPKEAALTLLLTWSAGGLATLFAGRAEPVWRFRLGAALAAMVSTVLLTVPLWLIFLDTLRASVTYYDAPAVRFAGRELAPSMVLGSLAADPLGPGLNPVAIALAMAALFSPGLLLAHRSILACVLVVVAALAIAYGAIPADAIIRVPLVANIHRLDLALFSAAIPPLSIITALGVQAALRANRATLAWLTAAIVGGASIFLGEIGGLKAGGGFPGVLRLLALAGAVAIPSSLRMAAGSFPRVLPIVSTIALSMLLLSPGGQHLETGIPHLDHVLVQPRPRVQLTDASPAVEAIRRAQTEPSRVLGLGSNLFPATPALHRLEGIEGPDALMPRGVRELLEASGAPPVVGWKRVFSRADTERVSEVLDMLNVEFVAGSLEELAPGDDALPMRDYDLLHAVRRANAWPRAFFVDRVASYTTANDLLAQVRQAGNPIASVLQGDVRAAAMTRELPMGSGEVVRADRYTLTTNTTTFHVPAPRAGVAVLSESYLPDDFIATLNGQAAPYFRVNHIAKGIAIPSAGDWEVRFEYRPRRWHLSIGAAALGLVILMGLLIVGRIATG